LGPLRYVKYNCIIPETDTDHGSRCEHRTSIPI